MNLAQIICFSSICSRVKKRFPTSDHLVEAGIMTSAEQKILENIEPKNVCKYWVPIVWASAVVECGRRENRIKSAYAHEALIRRITDFRTGLGTLLGYNTMSLPLLYSQTVTIGVYSYFVASGIGNQWLDPAMKYPFNEIDMVFPFFTFLQFLFYIGWLRAAEVMINPFGEDDDDFEINTLIDRNLTISYTIVDEMHHQHPELVRDAFWDVAPEIPHTIASEQIPEVTNLFVGSAENVEVHPNEAIYGRLTSASSMSSVNSGKEEPIYGSLSNFRTSIRSLTKRIRGSKRSSSRRQRSVKSQSPQTPDTDNDVGGAPLPVLQENEDLETSADMAVLESQKKPNDDDQKCDDKDVV
ncbi:unnamed protein product [Cyprideis torosa]|uniref:Bestrophin homolog n=1 Tax=Cyprideis torosa TaxID=163714 RepID=A0A7R8W9K0_9CRUS|nr:unnamed protein product [Cyprideis torosa]CAG0889841.1 unnamed protein product [Cyprideis torosa]